MTYDGEHLCMYLFAIVSLRRCLLSSLAIFKSNFLFSYCWVLRVLCIFWIAVFYWVYFFLPVCGFCFNSLEQCRDLLSFFFFLVVLGKELLWVWCLNFLYYKWIGSYKHSWNQWAEGLEVCFTVYDIFEATQLTDKPQCYRKNV